MKKNLAVIFGGKSTEHDISIITANQLMNAVDTQKYNLIPVYIADSGEWYSGNRLLDLNFYAHFNKKQVSQVAILPHSKMLFKKNFGKFKEYLKIDCAIISCHGKGGEDGSVQGLLELAGIPYQSSGILGSAIGLDKYAMKQIFRQNKIPIVEFVHITKEEYDEFPDLTYKLSLPVIVKPNSLGSSIGISICKTDEEFQEALKLAFLFDDVVIVEKLIENLKEVNVSVLGDKKEVFVSETEEVINSGFLSFDKKYLQNGQKTTKNGAKMPQNSQNSNKKSYNKLFCAETNNLSGMQNMGRIIPANITKTQKNKIKNLAQKIFECTKSKGVIRIDFMIDQSTGKVYANEVNTIPGSFAFYLWEKSGINFVTLVDKLVHIAENDALQKSKLTSTFASSVLSQSTNQISK